MKRRDAGKTIATFSLQLMGLPTWERLSSASVTSSSFDGSTFRTLEARTQNFWHLSKAVAPSALIHPVVGHFEMLTRLLRGTPPAALYQPLASLAAESAQIAARLFFDLKGYRDSTTFYDLSIQLARSGGNPVLETIGIVRKARDLLQRGYFQEASVQLQQAPQLSTQPGAAVAIAYHVAVTAKACSQISDTEICMRKLDESAHAVQKIQTAEDFYLTEFDASLLADFRGDCYLELRRFSDAEKAFQEAFSLSTSPSLRHQASVKVGLANAWMQQGELEKSCALANQALELTEQTQSWMILQYLITFRGRLHKWEKESYVKYLDEHIRDVRNKVPNLGAVL